MLESNLSPMPTEFLMKAVREAVGREVWHHRYSSSCPFCNVFFCNEYFSWQVIRVFQTSSLKYGCFYRILSLLTLKYIVVVFFSVYEFEILWIFFRLKYFAIPVLRRARTSPAKWRIVLRIVSNWSASRWVHGHTSTCESSAIGQVHWPNYFCL